MEDFDKGIIKGIQNDVEYIKRQQDEIISELRKIQTQLLFIHRKENGNT